MKGQAIMKLVYLMALLSVGACKSEAAEKKSGPTTVTSATAATSAATAAPSSAAAPEEKPLELRVSANGMTMQFEPTKLEAKAGQSVHLVFENKKPGTLPHNWALVAPGSEAKVAAAGVDKASDGYIVEGPDLLAYVKLAQPGTTTEVTFKAPAAGTYPYICTFPGHYMLMKGVLTVTP